MPEAVFIGVDLGWFGKPTGLASIRLHRGLRQYQISRLEGWDNILAWVQQEAGSGNAVIAVDAPLIIRNQTGIRPAERDLNRDFRRFHAGCHAANLGRPFARNVTAFSQQLETAGFRHNDALEPRQPGRFQFEVHPHAASVRLFDLEQIVKYKRGLRAHRARELNRLRRLMQEQLPSRRPAFSPELPPLPGTGPLKPAEDQIDAVLCAYIAAHWWYWGMQRNTVYGSVESGYIVVPGPFGSTL
jgi:predicted RNase H-like nuclease